MTLRISYMFHFVSVAGKKFIPLCWLKQIEEKSEYKRGNKWVNYYSRRVARPLKKMKKLFGDSVVL